MKSVWLVLEVLSDEVKNQAADENYLEGLKVELSDEITACIPAYYSGINQLL